MEMLVPVPSIPIGSIPSTEDQLGTGFFVGGMALTHLQDGPVTPRRFDSAYVMFAIVCARL